MFRWGDRRRTFEYWKYHRFHVSPWKYGLTLNRSNCRNRNTAGCRCPGWRDCDSPWCCRQTPPEPWLRSFPWRWWESGACSWCSPPCPAEKAPVALTQQLILRLFASVVHSVPTGAWPAAWCRTQTCSSSGVSGWERWWGRLSSRVSWWPGELPTQCCRRPASGCPAPPVKETK